MHGLLMSFTGYRRLHRVSGSARAQVGRAPHLLLPASGHLQDTYGEHQAIVSAVEARDPGRARATMQHHLGQLLTGLARLAREQPALFHSDA